MPPVVCCSCDHRTFKNKSRKIRCDSIPPIMVKVLAAPKNENLPEKLLDYYNAAKYVFNNALKPLYHNVMLSPRGFYFPIDENDEKKIIQKISISFYVILVPVLWRPNC